MNLNDLNNDLNYFTERISAETIKLNYAGIAIVWMFKWKVENFPSDLLVAFAFFVFSLFMYIFFLFFSARKIDETFAEEEARIENDISIPDAEKETVDFKGWDLCIVCKKKWLRRIYFLLCVIGYITLAVYVIRNFILR